MTLPELRRHKRSFIKLATNSAFSRAPDAAAAKRVFIEFLREQLLNGPG
jgi:protein KTI12